jgi:hypothetical protein
VTKLSAAVRTIIGPVGSKPDEEACGVLDSESELPTGGRVATSTVRGEADRERSRLGMASAARKSTAAAALVRPKAQRNPRENLR